MSSSVPALVNKEILVWARKSARMDVAAVAKKLSVARETVEAWEAGRKQLTIAKLRELAKIYRRPIAVFYLAEPPKDFQTPRDFRKMAPDEGMTPPLAWELRHANERRDVAVELAQQLGADIPKFGVTATLDEDPETVAERIRARLSVSVHDQQQWKGDAYRALREWTHATEAVGVLVFRATGIPVDIMRGFSVPNEELPAVVLNSKDVPTARVFSLFHELAHVALREGGICLDEEEPSGIERFCNHVAGAVAVPSHALLSHSIVRGSAGVRDWSEENLEQLAKSFSIGKESVLRRLLILNRTSQAHYKRMRALWQSRGRPPESTGFELPPHKALRSSGALFTSLVLSAYRDRVISASAVTDYLDVKMKYVGEVAELLRGRE